MDHLEPLLLHLRDVLVAVALVQLAVEELRSLRMLQALVEALDRTRADLAVASRYIPGGSYEGLTPLRRLMSLTATGMARTLLLRARAVTDPMSGFFALLSACYLP